jgi:maltose O-acetyltransferase
MGRISFKLKEFIYQISGDKEKLINLRIQFYKSLGVKIGENVRPFSPLVSAEPYLLSFGNNVTVSTNVSFITHDNSPIKLSKDYTDVFGKIEIGDDCFIGSGAIILPGVQLGKRVIVGAGSVVTKSFKEGEVIIGGNPAKVICSVEEYKTKVELNALNTKGLSYSEKKELILANGEKLIVK